MDWNGKRYHTLDYWMKREFGCKVVKLSLDGGFTCPNRDGSIGSRGCIFCGERGSGEHGGRREHSIPTQRELQKRILARKWPKAKYLAYFQSFSNTYAPLARLQEKYEEALKDPDVVGLAIATRPDCLPLDIVDYIGALSKTTSLWVELGLQTMHSPTASFLRRGYDLACFSKGVGQLQERGVRVVVHLIFGLPGETRADMLESVSYVLRLGVFGVKFHSLYIQEDTDLGRMYQQAPFPLQTRQEHIHLVCDALELLPEDIVVHRVTGDAPRALLLAPSFSADKLRVLSGIDQELLSRDSYQGRLYSCLK